MLLTKISWKGFALINGEFELSTNEWVADSAERPKFEYGTIKIGRKRSKKKKKYLLLKQTFINGLLFLYLVNINEFYLYSSIKRKIEN